MRIAIDIDGVTADFATPANEWMAQELDVEPVEPLQWEWYRQYGERGEKVWRAFWRMVERTDGEWFYGLSAVPGALEGVSALELAGHTVDFVTARNKRYHEVTRNWLYEHGFMAPLFCEREKWTLGHDRLLDDNVDNVEAFHSKVGGGCLYLQPWNTEEYWSRLTKDVDSSLPGVVSWSQYTWHVTGVGVE